MEELLLGVELDEDPITELELFAIEELLLNIALDEDSFSPLELGSTDAELES